MSLCCPYCEHEIDDPDDCYDPCVDYEKECPSCEKVFTFQVEYTREYYANKADCLNEGEHVLLERNHYTSEGVEVWLHCRDCSFKIKKGE